MGRIRIRISLKRSIPSDASAYNAAEEPPMRIAFSAWVAICLLGLTTGAARAKPIKLAILGIEAVDEGDVSSQEKTASIAKSFTEALRARAALLASKGYTI